MNHPRRTLKALAAVVAAGAAALASAPAAPAAERPAASAPAASSASADAPAETPAPSVRYLWAGSHTFDVSLDDGATTLTGYFQYAGTLPYANPSDLASGTDVRTTTAVQDGVTTVTQASRLNGDGARFVLPKGQVFRAATGWSVVVQDGSSSGRLRVWRPQVLLPRYNAITGNQVTGIPTGANVYRVQPGGSVRYMAVAYNYQGVLTAGLVDLTTYAFRAYRTGFASGTEFRFNDQWFAADEGPDHTLSAVRVGSAPGTAPVPLGDGGAYRLRAVVGDHLLLADPDPSSGQPPLLDTVSAADGTRRTFFGDVPSGVAFTQEGGAIATARDEAGAWYVYHLVAGTEGLAAVPSWNLDPQEESAAGRAASR